QDASNQGQVGDCYFLAAMDSMAATNPQGVKDMIKDNKDGSYTVTFPSDTKNPVTVGAPTDAELARYGQVGQDGTWPAILEKAYGKYSQDSAVPPQEGVPDGSTDAAGVKLLSQNGKDTDNLTFTTEAQFSAKAQQAIEDGQPITAGINNELGSLIGVS